MFTLHLSARKPRNPLVVAARFRKAGRHGDGSGHSTRQQARNALRRELDRLRHSP